MREKRKKDRSAKGDRWVSVRKEAEVGGLRKIKR